MGDAVALLRVELEKKQQELQALQDAFDEFTQSSQELEAELEAELERAERSNTQLSRKVHTMETELSATREQLDRTLQQLRVCENEVTALRLELSRVSDLKRELEQQQDELVTQVRILQATEDDLRHRMEREMEEKVFLQSDQEELRQEHELVTERLRMEILDLKSEIFVLQQQQRSDSSSVGVDATTSAPTSLANGPIDELRNALSQAHDEEMGCEDPEPMEWDDSNVTMDENEEFPSRPSTLDERDEEDREQLIETLTYELEELSLRLQDEMELRERLEADLVAAQDAIAQSEAMDSEMMQMSEELIEKSQEIRKLELEVQSLQERVSSMRGENGNLIDENVALKAHQQQQETQYTLSVQTSKNRIDSLRAECDSLQATERELRSHLQSEQQQNQQLRLKNEELTVQIEELTRRRKDLELRLEKEVKKKQKELAELQAHNSVLTQQLETASQKAADLERSSALSTTSSSVSSPSSVSSSSTSPRSRSASGHSVAQRDVDAGRKLLLEIQSLRTTVHSLQAENARLRQSDGSSSSLLPSKRVSAELLAHNFTSDQLAQKYIAERTRNASLLSRLQTVCGNIQVFCRVRPVIAEEVETFTAKGISLAVSVVNQSDIAALDVRPERVFGDSNQPPDANTGDLMGVSNVNADWKVFTFDRVIGPSETQVDVFREVEPIAQSVVEGFKACIFAYGQTGSGKTFTMEGHESDPGLNYRVVQHIFQSIVLRGAIYDPNQAGEDEVMQDDVSLDNSPQFGPSSSNTVDLSYHIEVGVLEIYNETLRDLVDPENSASLDIRQDPMTGDICVPHLTMKTVVSPEDTIAVLRHAQSNRVTGKTDVHAHSSRSHSVIVLQISTKTSTGSRESEGLLDSYVSGKLYLVDLAGSERVKKSNVSGAMLREAAHINKSLSALADVMEALDKKHQHVPYRNSKLTYLLQDVLNSSCKTVMIVNVGPTLQSANETFRSLQFAERVRNIVVGRNSIVKNKKDILSAKRAFTEIQSLKQQVQICNRKLKQSQQTIVAMKRDQKSHSDETSNALQSRLRAAETQITGMKTQSDSLKRINQELTDQLKQEREAKQRETEQREAAQRMLRQLTSKTRVSTSHQEALERQLKDRDDEIRKLRQLLTEARQRTAAAVVPRRTKSPPRSVSKVLTDDDEPHGIENQDNNQEEEENAILNEQCEVDSKQLKSQVPMSAPHSSATRLPKPKFGSQRGASVGSLRKSQQAPSSTKSDVGAGGGASKFRRISSSSLPRPTWK
ncbi:hypothetical protein PINS_up014257 [Pythium insidiosum]|nr:hypothetical protein PINS_up014257 [Pythium insidiosum]